ncbi:MAG: fluoride efflux transporter CrcB [Clostridiales bacterium]|jgi:CrcB protein|nr:fluoride efflux transporter CrcB [Clostridiales bacterium]
MSQFIAVGVGGFIGACARFGITKLMSRHLTLLPFGTLLSNVIAGFFIGLIIGIERQTTTLPEHLKLFLMVGILGGLSTFSTFSMETVAYIENAQYLKATANTILNIALCFLFVFVGLLIAKYIKRFV